MLQRRPHIGVVSAAVGACLIACVLIGGRSGLHGRGVVLLGAEDVNVHLRASVDSLAWACGGREVAEVCLISTETCVASMQKKIQYTVEQYVARDMGTCSCFQGNGCSSSCNSAMATSFGMGLACPLDSTAYLYSQQSPLDFGGFYDGAYNDVVPMVGTAGAYYKANPRSQQLARLDPEEPVYAVPVAAKMMGGRKL